MAIARYEPVTVNTLTEAVSNLGEQSESETVSFTSAAIVSDVANSLRISERYRVYSDLVNLTFRYTPNIKDIVDNQDEYSFTYRGNDWRIMDCREANDRMSVTFSCYRNDPSTPV